MELEEIGCGLDSYGSS